MHSIAVTLLKYVSYSYVLLLLLLLQFVTFLSCFLFLYTGKKRKSEKVRKKELIFALHEYRWTSLHSEDSECDMKCAFTYCLFFLFFLCRPPGVRLDSHHAV